MTTAAITPATLPTRRARRATAADRRPGLAARLAVRAQRLLLNVAAVVGALSLLAVAACLALGVRPAVVVSGSMAPGIPVGAVTLARSVPADSVAVGDVVTVPRTDGRGLVTHRVIETTPLAGGVAGATELRLQGDANTEPDAQPYAVAEVGQVLGSVPHVGYAVVALQENLVAVVAGLLTLTVLVTFPARAAARRR
ncbi:signal peptidase I [Cellulomonas sp. C5510]|uniref:signal peptidase I n=1 Tax=Cellulomonas sp. C5510 TaxID=2871170 RepID=UPI001C93E974|nr:signal peptidase I [Cellulomonas sp. C5510]QZN86813.1 signal peptidase I [Cellulomonas sp. C5510]